MFCKDCLSCNDCFGCIYLKNKQYCIFNKQYSKDEYLNFIKNINIDSYSKLIELRIKCMEFMNQFKKLNLRVYNSENCSGDLIYDSKNCSNCFTLASSEKCDDCFECARIFDCNNCDFTYDSEGKLTFCSDVALGYDSCFVIKSTNFYNCYYSFMLYNCNNCFGCIGLRNKEYCILNKQYSKDEYFIKLEQILNDMKNQNILGNFFPDDCSHLYKSYSKRQLMENADELNILEFYKEILKKLNNQENLDNSMIINCISSNKKFLLQKQEIDFYKKTKLPIPRLHPETREFLRLASRKKPIFVKKLTKFGEIVISKSDIADEEKIIPEKQFKEYVENLN